MKDEELKSLGDNLAVVIRSGDVGDVRKTMNMLQRRAGGSVRYRLSQGMRGC